MLKSTLKPGPNEVFEALDVSMRFIDSVAMSSGDGTFGFEPYKDNKTNQCG